MHFGIAGASESEVVLGVSPQLLQLAAAPVCSSFVEVRLKLRQLLENPVHILLVVRSACF